MTVDALFSTLTGQTADLLVNEGNAGDALILQGAQAVARKHGVVLNPLFYPEKRRGSILFTLGSGTFCRNHWHGVRFLRYYEDAYDRIIVLPGSMEIAHPPVRDYFSNLPSKVTVFCREKYSYESLLPLVPDPSSLHLDHDLAFQLDVSPYLQPGKGSMYSFRMSSESIHRVHLTHGNFDSQMGREYSGFLLLDVCKHYETVYTDFLHVAIAATLLNRNVVVFPNDYHKMLGVYEFSLTRYPNTRLATPDDWKALPIAPTWRSRLESRLQRPRRKLHHILRRLTGKRAST